jgi:agmatinase
VITQPSAASAAPARKRIAKVDVVGVPMDLGADRRGVDMGPSAIRYARLKESLERLGMDVTDHGNLRVPVPESASPAVQNAKYFPIIQAVCKELAGIVEGVIRGGAFPLVLGGDHSIALPDVTGVARHHGFGNVAVVHFDAHADTGNLEFGSLLGHGQPMRRLLESGACRGDRFLQIGLRGYWPPPDTLDWMAGQEMRSYEMTEVVRRGLDACLDEAFATATDGCDAVFLSVDVDVVDPGMAPGTGTPEPGGLTGRQLLDAVRRCAIELPLVGADVVEVSPPYDHADVTAMLANRVVLEILSGTAFRRSGRGEIPPTLLGGRR